MKIYTLIVMAFLISACSGGSSGSAPNSTTDNYSIDLEFTRLSLSDNNNSFKVNILLKNNSVLTSGKSLDVTGNNTVVVDNGNGSYSFNVYPTSSGIYSVSVAFSDVNISREALAFDRINDTLRTMPLSVPGDYVNTEGYEDGITITPDGKYLFLQYGPLYPSGIIFLKNICNDSSLSSGYNLNDCESNATSEWVFKTKGPYDVPYRPGFPTGRITNDGNITHLSDIVIANQINGLHVPPTTFYGFKKQEDGTFAEPFTVKFDSDKDSAIQSAYGLSFVVNDANSSKFLFAWNNYKDQKEDDKVEVYYGNISMEVNTSLGLTTSGVNTHITSTITPNFLAVPFAETNGTQGNPHLYEDGNGDIASIWVDDEVTSKDLSVYTLLGSYPNGTWSKETLPSTINTGQEESQPFFSGTKLYLRRGENIVSHNYLGGAFTSNANWGAEVIILGSTVNTTVGELVAVGEPTLAQVGSDVYLYFVYALLRSKSVSNLSDLNMNAGYVKLP